MPNRLANETSPYLLQHAGNPVDWWPWCDQAFAEARRRNAPVMLSSGYSACHWCHVMERESFEDGRIAGLLNENFVPVKVDREERPDVDQVYQEAVQALTGQGGWPLTVFLTPEGEPFFGGTYFPPFDLGGRPGFARVLEMVAKAWRERAGSLREIGRRMKPATPGRRREGAVPPDAGADAAVRSIVSMVDKRNGGFGRAPKFPNPSALLLMLEHGRSAGEDEPVEAALFSLRCMARGGIRDHLGGGFHRYAVDDRWLVPHFEKMLYDNAQMLGAYTAAFQITGGEEFATVAREIVAYIGREMTASDGGFFSSQDADSEGGEGRFYLWSLEEVREALGNEELFEAARLYYGLTDNGAVDGRNVLRLAEEAAGVAGALGRPCETTVAELARIKEILASVRAKRPRPWRDEKIILGWNGLMISGLARAWQGLGDADALELAARAARFAWRRMGGDGRHMSRVHTAGRSRIPAFFEDYAYFVAGLLDLYESDFDPEWLRRAMALQETVLSEFSAGGGRYHIGNGQGERRLSAPASAFDRAMPSGVAVHCTNLIRLHALTMEDKYESEARKILASYAGEIEEFPLACAALTSALEMFRKKPVLVVAAGAESDPGQMENLRRLFIPYRVLAGRPAGRDGLSGNPAAAVLRDRPAIDGKATFYVCSGFVCHPPVTDWREAETLLQ